MRALVVAPTRELAEQIHSTISELGRETGLRSVTVYGGVGINPQIARLKKGVEIVIACPGRLLDHLNQKTIDLSRLEVLVLDEADQMFDMGFLPDVRRIFARLPKQRQTMLFSATISDEVMALSARYMNRPEEGMQAPDKMTVDEVHQTCFLVPQERKKRKRKNWSETTD